MSSRDTAGRPVCQVDGCQEAAKPWGYSYTFGHLRLVLILCGRHEYELAQQVPEAAEAP